MCATRPGNENGSLICKFTSLPNGTLDVLYDLPNDTGITIYEHNIIIAESSEDYEGIYNCTATNLVGGNYVSVSRIIELFVGGM